MYYARLLLFVSLALLPALSFAVDTKPLTFGIVPQQSAAKLARLWGPIMRHLSEQTGRKIVFKTAPNIPAFEKRVLAGEYDVAYMNPYHFTVFNQKPGYHAVARQANKLIKGIIVVRKDSKLEALSELQGKKLAFPAPAAFAASVLPRAELTQQGVAFDPNYVSSHDSVYRNVAKGLFPAGGGIQRTLNNVAPDIREQLRVMWTTSGYTPHAIAVHPDMDEATRKAVQGALLAMNDSEKGRQLLATIKFKGIEPATDKDWDDVRALNITLLADLLK